MAGAREDSGDWGSRRLWRLGLEKTLAAGAREDSGSWGSRRLWQLGLEKTLAAGGVCVIIMFKKKLAPGPGHSYTGCARYNHIHTGSVQQLCNYGLYGCLHCCKTFAICSHHVVATLCSNFCLLCYSLTSNRKNISRNVHQCRDGKL